MRQLPSEVCAAAPANGARNATILTPAPTGTTGTMVGADTGIEPFYLWRYTRTGRLGAHQEQVAVVARWRRLHPAEPCRTSSQPHGLHPRGARSRTGNNATPGGLQHLQTGGVPARYTVAETRRRHEPMYTLGCKGDTIYRDDSREQQVLSAIGCDTHDAAAAELAGNATPAVSLAEQLKARPLPPRRQGVTVSKPSSEGTAHITMNDDDSGSLPEVFVEIGRAGGDLKVWQKPWSGSYPRYYLWCPRSPRSSVMAKSQAHSRESAAAALTASAPRGCAPCRMP